MLVHVYLIIVLHSDKIQLECITNNNPRLQNHKSCKILPKFSSTVYFLQKSYKFVQESQIFQICYNVEHFVQRSDNIFAKKCIFFREKFSQKM